MIIFANWNLSAIIVSPCKVTVDDEDDDDDGIFSARRSVLILGGWIIKTGSYR